MNIKKSKKSMNFLPYILLAIVVVFSLLILNNLNKEVKELNYTELTVQINSGNVTELTVTPKSASGVYIITGKLKDYSKNQSFKVTIPYTDTVISSL